jgi:hypothetical protein
MTKSYQQAEDEYFERLWLEAEQRAIRDKKREAVDDTVNKPKHYMLFSPNDLAWVSSGQAIEVRDVLEKLVNKIREGQNVPFWKGVPMFESDYVQMMQYGMRFMDKNGVEDLKKMRWYLDKMIEAYDSNS